MPICLRNLSSHPTVIHMKIIVGKLTPANQVPLAIPVMGTFRVSSHDSKKGVILDELDLQGLRNWSKGEWKQTGESLTK